MTRIAELLPRVCTKTFDKPPSNPRTTWREKNTFLVFVRTEGGEIGVGEVWCEALSPAVLAAFVRDEMAPLFRGADIEDMERLWQIGFDRTRVSAKPGLALSVLGAVETALWDLTGKRHGRPLYRLLGACRDRVDVYASGGLYGEDNTPARLADEMAGYVRRGFRAVKMKVGGKSLAEDMARVAAVREAIGPDIRLMVDAVYMLDGSSALRMARALDRLDIWFLEAPLAPGDLTGLRRLTARSPVPIAGNEVAFGLDSYRDLIVEGGIDVVHLDVNQCGGIGEARRIAALAAAFHRPVSFHSATSAVCFAANLHVAASLANTESVEYHCVHQMLFDQVPADRYPLVDGAVVLPDAPGLGIDIDPCSLREV
ncbi:mandelate racemase/muconate lactonizing enzyme family protein [Paralcaligenes ureilyticus]|uniref:D-arabinonate dehydratase n=1 Tax=Paralcaligenes ureilyticus TaxID=627131 RepID=A0A4R3M027_9BURK|nr:mandelate racemase/muconate lactonizing enzyme family protein [Paralcaligenes ureilyticus]TCT06312.1 D-arabinonate dehydratase [Paralcaligenes ureilyticus]